MKYFYVITGIALLVLGFIVGYLIGEQISLVNNYNDATTITVMLIIGSVIGALVLGPIEYYYIWNKTLNTRYDELNKKEKYKALHRIPSITFLLIVGVVIGFHSR